MSFAEAYESAAVWLNGNSGVVSTGIFAITLFLGWTSGIFRSLRRRPVLKISLIDGPTFSCTYFTGEEQGEYKIHRTGVAVYMRVRNIGSAPTSIDNVALAYHWNLNKINWLWVRYVLGWFWIDHPAVALEDFQVQIAGSVRVYPFLIQVNNLIPNKQGTYLEEGQSTTGVVYFEQQDSWGGCAPRNKNNQTKIKLKISDAFGKQHSATFKIPVRSYEEACKYNPSFGLTRFAHEITDGEPIETRT